VNHDLTVNSPQKRLINLASSPIWGNRFLLICASDALIQGGDTVTFTWSNGFIVKPVTMDVLESQMWVNEDGSEVYMSLVHFDR
jgi:hypothetical protein